MASILIVSGSSEGDYYLLGREPVMVGRGEGCHIQIVDDAVSRRHFQIRPGPQAGGYIVQDMESANGTLVNEQPIKGDTPLADGDVIGIGSTELMFSSVDFADRETAFQHYRGHGEGAKSTVIRRRE
ncbi:MAG: FHA domain-containing protein [Planctomycetota bacterium]|jgi:pSer/pThr/pTyr-binding forkhead associated (FHA) protein